jgi:hypothetical protein
VLAILATPPLVSADPVRAVFTTAQSAFTTGVLNQGWYSPNFPSFQDDLNDNYIVVSNGFEEFRNFFTFDLRTLRSPVTTATLEVVRHDGGNLIYDVFDVTTDAATLNMNGTFKSDVFEDLGTGVGFGSFPIGTGPMTEVLRFPLNAAGVAAISRSSGGFFSVGGAVQGRGLVFGNSQGSVVRLVINDGAAPTAEPATLLLTAAGLITIARRGQKANDKLCRAE